MEYRLLGGSGFKVPVLTLGTGTFGGKGELFSAWGNSGVPEAKRLVDICLDAGLTMFDSADGYSDGMAEEILGKAIAGRRDKVLISTKATFRVGDGPNDVGSSRFHLLRAVEDSLKRLGTDYIDLFQLHAFDAMTPVEETLSTLDTSGARGKNPLRRLLQFFRLAFDEIARRGRQIRLSALRRASGLLLADWPRLRMGIDAARPRPESGRGRVESARLGAADGKNPAQPAVARRSRACNPSSTPTSARKCRMNIFTP